METAETTVDSTDKAGAVSMSPPAPCSAADVRAILNSRIISAESATTATIVRPALPIEPGDYKVTMLRSPGWFFAWGRRQNAALTGGEAVPSNGVVGPSESEDRRFQICQQVYRLL